MSTLRNIIIRKVKSFVGGRTLPASRRLVVSHIMRELGDRITGQYTANQMLAMLKGQGYGVRRQWFLRQFKYTKETGGNVERQQRQESKTRLRRSDMDYADASLTHNYSYQLEMQVRGYTETSPTSNRDVDEWGQQQYWFGSDKLMSPDEVVEAFKAKFQDQSMAKVDADWSTLQFNKATRYDPNRDVN